MGLVTPNLVEALKKRHLVAEEAVYDMQASLGEWLARWQCEEGACEDFLAMFFGLPYVFLEGHPSLRGCAIPHQSFVCYQQVGTNRYFVTTLLNDEEQQVFQETFPSGHLALTDASVVKSLLLSEHVETHAFEQRYHQIFHAVEEWCAQGKSHVDGLLGTILKDAILQAATDIHLYVQEQAFHVRFRCHGIFETYALLPVTLAEACINKLKLVAEMDIAEHRLPQDGHFQIQYQGHYYHLRLGTLPLREGEKIVIRLLPTQRQHASLAELGFQRDAIEALERVLQQRQGMVLITGPTNSGKTTTLYALLHGLSAANQMIYTIEDPIEAILPRVQQMQVNVKGGFAFATGLRGILRSDPDIIAIGELRDKETVEIAARAALSGHLVLATLHAYDAQQAIGRLRDLGLSDLLIGAVVRLIVNQRLVAKSCSACHGTGITKDERCCRHCEGRGSIGRKGIQEVWVLDDDDRRAIEVGDSTVDLRFNAVQKGFVPLAME